MKLLFLGVVIAVIVLRLMLGPPSHEFDSVATQMHAAGVSMPGADKPGEGMLEFLGAKLTDWLLAAFTALLAWFTWELKRSTDRMWRVTKRALKSSEASQLPRLYPELSSSHLLPEGVHEIVSRLDRPPAYLEYRFTNYGGSGAFIEEVRDRLVFVEGLPDETLTEGGPMHIVPSRNLQRGDRGEPIKASLGRALSDDELALYRQRGQDPPWRFFLLIRVKYQDVFGYTITERFCMKVMPPAERHLERKGGAARNFRHRERLPD